MAKIYYSLDEAEKMASKLEKRIENLMALNESINDITELQITIKGDEIEDQLFALDLNRQFHKASHELYEELHTLTGMGCIVKDLEIGLVDFYSKHEDRDIFLCWKYGEPGIRHWHETGEGFQHRKSVSIVRNAVQEKLRRLR